MGFLSSFEAYRRKLLIEQAMDENYYDYWWAKELRDQLKARDNMIKLADYVVPRRDYGQQEAEQSQQETADDTQAR